MQVPDPSLLLDPEIAEEARGAKLVYQDKLTAKTQQATFFGAKDSAIKVFSHGAETAVRPGQIANARLKLKAGKMTPQTCIGSPFLGLTIGGILGSIVGKNIYDNATEGGQAGARRPSSGR